VVLWFAVLGVGFFNPYAGLNYAILRHLLPPLVLVAAWRCFEHPTAPRFVGTVALLVIALAYSPEVAVVALGSLVFLSILCLSLGRGGADSERAGAGVHVALPLLSLSTVGGLFVLMDSSLRALQGYLQPILTFSAGGWNTPIDPSLPMLGMAGLTVLALAHVVGTVRTRGWNSETAWVVVYAIMAIALERAALAKADVAHIVYSGLPACVLAVAALEARAAPTGPRGRLFAAVLVCLILPLQLFNAMLYAPFVTRHAVAVGAEAQGSGSTAAVPGKADIMHGIAMAIERFGTEQTYYMHKLEYYRLPVYERYRLKPFLYFPSLTSAFTEENIQTVIRELASSHAIVIARRQDLLVRPRDSDGRMKWFHGIMASPLPSSTVYDLTLRFQAQLEQPLVDFLSSAYSVGFEYGDVVALVPREL
jgi:hypothetical protein